MKTMYSNYMNNNQNQVFMSKVSEHLTNINKINPKNKNEFKFLEKDPNFQNFDYSDLLKTDKSKIIKDFQNTLSSPLLHDEIQRQSNYIKDVKNQNLLTNANDLLNEGYSLASKDENVFCVKVQVKNEGNKLYAAIHNFANEHENDFKNSRFLSISGQNVEDPEQYVKKEVSFLNKNHLNDNIFDSEMKIENIDKLLNADEFLNK